uniref:Uncharacterized protein n=1 Tax=viral metagenome TaxID=1070528 RepID=A0A6M3LJH3_9ZZZZ
MCNHIFNYPEDKRENYNPDGKTLTGICKHCGLKHKSYGLVWAIQREEDWAWQGFYKDEEIKLDNPRGVC